MANAAPNERPPATLAEMLREELAAWDAAARAAFRLPPYNPDELLTRKGIDTYDRMMDDPQVRGSINTKRYALMARPWQVFPAVRDTQHPDYRAALEARDFVEDALRGLRGPDGSPQDFRRTLFQMMSAFYRGFSLAELVWRVHDGGRWAGRYTLAAIKFKNPRQIGFEVDEFLNVRAITSLTHPGGLVTVPRAKVLLYVYSPHDELPYGDSDLRAAYHHWYSKQAIVGFWNLRLQRYGLPFAYATAAATGPAAAEEVRQLLRELQQESSAVLPPNVRLQLMEPRGDGAEPFATALDWHNQQITVGILLQTLATTEGRKIGSMALGRVHFDILLFALECLKQDVEAAVNAQIVRPLVDLNFDHGLCPRFTLGHLEERDLLPLAQAVDVLLNHRVVAPTEPVLREMFNLPPAVESGA